MFRKAVFFAAVLMIITGSCSADEVMPINPNADHVERWNWFVDAVYALHKKKIKGKKLDIRTSVGGYFREPNFYKENKYFDKDTNKLLSIIRWEREHPNRIHWIEVYVYDNKGRVTRDYSAAFLTFSRAAPQQTIINLHAYNGELHAHRQFDATDIRTFEKCEGVYKGRKIELEYDDMDIIEFEDEPKGPFTTPEYKACFAGLPVKSAGKYLTPQ